ncbi:hypothetical protein HPB50_018579 [Hyalomma asiaticum]|uniref:Uncharacterized protein n=1 Tax=Hyalomma asiaticum TaxID=266040 RepID=A0ACB7SZZ8_HYAAI|nr:hypothetical protein HPB50_018579 [Hyalomma asiaticum]
MTPAAASTNRAMEPFMGHFHQLLVEWNRQRQVAQRCRACRHCQVDFHALVLCFVVLTMLCVILVLLMVHKRRRRLGLKLKPEPREKSGCLGGRCPAFFVDVVSATRRGRRHPVANHGWAPVVC